MNINKEKQKKTYCKPEFELIVCEGVQPQCGTISTHPGAVPYVEEVAEELGLGTPNSTSLSGRMYDDGGEETLNLGSGTSTLGGNMYEDGGEETLTLGR